MSSSAPLPLGDARVQSTDAAFNILGNMALAIALVLFFAVRYLLFSAGDSGEIHSALAPLYNDSSVPGGVGHNVAVAHAPSDAALAGTWRLADPGTKLKFVDGSSYAATPDDALLLTADHRFRVHNLGVFNLHGQLYCLVDQAGTWSEDRTGDPNTLQVQLQPDPGSIRIGRTVVHPPDPTLPVAADPPAKAGDAAVTTSSGEAVETSKEDQEKTLESPNQSGCAASHPAFNSVPFTLMRRHASFALYRVPTLYAMYDGSTNFRVVYEQAEN